MVLVFVVIFFSYSSLFIISMFKIDSIKYEHISRRIIEDPPARQVDI